MAGLDSVGFRSTVAAAVQRRSVAVSVVCGLLYAVSALLIALASPLSDNVDFRQLRWGVAAFVVAVLGGALREWAQIWVDKGQVAAAAQFRTAVKDALRPVATQIALLQKMRRGAARNGQLKVVATQVVGSMQLLLTEVGGIRTVVYKLEGPDRLVLMATLGREDHPAGDFVRHPSGEPDLAFEALEQNLSRLVGDTRSASIGTPHTTDHGYRSYMSVPIVVGDDAYGMVTVDAPDADAFTDTDLKLCEFVAELLGIAFVACAEPPKKETFSGLEQVGQ